MSLTGSGSLDPGLNEGANQGSQPAGGGDMYKATYDTNNDGVVDDSDRLGGQLPAYYATAADLATALAQAVAAQAALTAHTALSNPHGTSLEQVRAVSNAITARITGSGLFTGNFIDLNNNDYGGTKTVLKSGNTVLVLGDTDAYFTDAAALFGLYINTVSGISQLYNDYGAITLNPDGSISAGNGELKDVANPTLGTSAVNKNYADGLVVGLEAQSNKNQNNGYAGLDNNGLIPSTLLPSYVDDVLEFANLAAFPVTGESEKVYIALDTFKIYRWSGSIYVEISPSPGSTDDVPEGSVNKYFQESRVLGTILAGLSVASSAIITAADSVLIAIGKLQAQITANLATLTAHTSNTSNPHSVTKAQVGLSDVDNTSDLSKPLSTAQIAAIAVEEGRWKTIAVGHAFHVAAQVTAADVYWHQALGQVSIRQGTGSSNPPSFVYLRASDYVSAIGLTPKLRIKVSLASVNDVAPGRTITPGLYPCSGPTSGTTGAINTRVYNAGTVVPGSNGLSFATPAADSMVFNQYSSVFSFPADGLYSIASLIDGALAANSGVHLMCELQYHFEA